LLREVAGNLEFRNELIRAHAYYEVPSTVRLEMHRRIGSMLQIRGGSGEQNDLEIAWHFILGRDPTSAVPHAITGAEHSLRAGAAREAELLLRHLVREELREVSAKHIQLLLGSALMLQSKAEEALPYLESLLSDDHVSKPQVAQAAGLFASAMYLLNRDSSARHSEMAERAVQIARECNDKDLLAHALFESARAGVESGNAALTQRVFGELQSAIEKWPVDAPPIAYHAHAYCSYYLSRMVEACESAERAVKRLTHNGNLAELAMALTGLGNCMTAVCRFEEARNAYNLALKYARKVGDDCRISSVMCNLAALHLLRGEIEASIAAGQESLAIGKRAPAQPTLLKTWSNLVYAHVLSGEIDCAQAHVAAWQQWIQNGRSWAARLEFCCNLACMELVLGNTTEALRLTQTIDRESQGRDSLVLNQGTLERLRVFSTYHTKGAESARQLAVKFMERFKGQNLLAYLDALAAFAWTEKKSTGRYSELTANELQLFVQLGLHGKRGILIAEGYLDRSGETPQPPLILPSPA
jgi:tetratricopeptide (TPR) repeat protein